jgi:thiamine pyrophosphokinase
MEEDQAATLQPERKSEAPGGEGRQLRRRRQEAEAAAKALLEQADIERESDDNTWYLYLPGLIGAGTALLVVGVVSALSFSTWRKNQN